jgi:hypothetical protein
MHEPRAFEALRGRLESDPDAGLREAAALRLIPLADTEDSARRSARPPPKMRTSTSGGRPSRIQPIIAPNDAAGSSYSRSIVDLRGGLCVPCYSSAAPGPTSVTISGVAACQTRDPVLSILVGPAVPAHQHVPLRPDQFHRSWPTACHRGHRRTAAAAGVGDRCAAGRVQRLRAGRFACLRVRPPRPPRSAGHAA